MKITNITPKAIPILSRAVFNHKLTCSVALATTAGFVLAVYARHQALKQMAEVDESKSCDTIEKAKAFTTQISIATKDGAPKEAIEKLAILWNKLGGAGQTAVRTIYCEKYPIKSRIFYLLSPFIGLALKISPKS